MKILFFPLALFNIHGDACSLVIKRHTVKYETVSDNIQHVNVKLVELYSASAQSVFKALRIARIVKG